MTEDGFDGARVGACGFYCGSCPTYLKGACGGCGTSPEATCFTYRCVRRKGLRFCGECEAFPCDVLLTREKVTVLDKAWLRCKKES